MRGLRHAPRPPQGARAVAILVGSSWLRSFNRLRALFGVPWSARRRPTPRKGSGLPLLAALFGVFLFWQAANFATEFVARTADHVSSQERLDWLTYHLLVEYDHRSGGPGGVRPEEAPPEELRSLFLMEVQLRGTAADRQEDVVGELVRHYAGNGLAGFRSRQADGPHLWPSAGIWPEGEAGRSLVPMAALAASLLGLCLLCIAVGASGQELSAGDQRLAMLATLPLTTRALMAARLLEYAWINPFLWLTAFPFAFVILVTRGAGWWSLPAAAGVTALCGLQLGALRLLIETWLRRRLTPAAARNLQALAGLLGTVLFFLLFWLIMHGATSPAVNRAVASLPAAAWWNPAAMPVQLAVAGSTRWIALAALAAVTALAAGGAVLGSAALLRRGLLPDGQQSGRRVSAATARRGWFRGIVAKDLLLLRRDRQLLVQSVLVPVLVVAFQFIVQPTDNLAQLTHRYRNVAVAAFGIGAYALTFSACRVVVHEGSGLWLLFASPSTLGRALLRKTLLWTGIAMSYTVLVLSGGALLAPHLEWRALLDAATAVIGIVLFGPIAASVGVLGSRA